jgi:hypothetical protein
VFDFDLHSFGAGFFIAIRLVAGVCLFGFVGVAAAVVRQPIYRWMIAFGFTVSMTASTHFLLTHNCVQHSTATDDFGRRYAVCDQWERVADPLADEKALAVGAAALTAMTLAAFWFTNEQRHTELKSHLSAIEDALDQRERAEVMDDDTAL